MALIGKIREKSVLLVVIIGLALLAFIFTDWYKGGGGDEDQIGYGTVAGEMVDFKKYEEAQTNFMRQGEQNAQQQGKEYTPKDQEASKDQAWNFTVESIIIEKEMEALGMNVGKSEFDDYLLGKNGFPVMQEFQDNFKDSVTGLFNSRLLEQRIEQMSTASDPEQKKQWEESKKYYIDRRKREKYEGLLAQGVYATTVEAEDEYYAKGTKKTIDYIMRRYSDIKDEEIKVTDKELQAYYEEHKNEKQYENKFASREVKFFDILIKPSIEDVKKMNQEMAKFREGLKNTKNDSIYVMANSDEKRFAKGNQMTHMPANDPKAKGLTYPAEMDTIFKKAAIGDIVGPYNDGDYTKLAKVTNFNTNRLKVRHILLSAPREDSAKVQKVAKTADSIIGLLNSANFEQYVVRFSEDPGSKDKGGVYEDFMDFEMVPEFSEFAVSKPIGAIGKVQTQFGWHIMENMARTPVKYPVLTVISKSNKPSDVTIENVKDEAYDMLYKLDAKMKNKKGAAKIEVFDTIASRAGFVPRPIVLNENKIALYGFQTTFAEDKIIRLAFSEGVEVGTLSSAPIQDKDRFIIAVVSQIKEKGVPKFDDVKESMRIKVIEDKKAKRFIYNLRKGGSLAAMGKKLGSEVLQAEITFSSPQIPGVGFEPEVVGSVFAALKEGQKTLPIKGKNGVYVVQVKKITNAPATKVFDAEKASLLTTMRSTASNLARAALIDKADVVDNRRFLAIGLRR